MTTPVQRRPQLEMTDDDEDDVIEEEEEEIVFETLPAVGRISVKRSLWRLLTQESRSVSCWAALALLFRLAIALLLKLAEYQKSDGSSNDASSWSNDFYLTMSVVAGWVLSILPTKVTAGLAPGFIFSSGWLLMFVAEKFGPIPSLPLRICEMVLGRLSLRQLAIILPIHFVCALSTVMIFRLILPQSLSSLAVGPIVYADGNPWMADFFQEIIVTAAFTVSILVLPELFALNKLPRWMATFVMYPFYGYAVDSAGMGSTFSPNIVYALAAAQPHQTTNDQPDVSVTRFLATVLGGLLGGKIMTIYFPDDDQM